MNLVYKSFFYGNLDKNGFNISYLLISRKIDHDFLFVENDFIFTVQTSRKMREIVGYRNIYDYINEYRYIFDFPEVARWNT